MIVFNAANSIIYGIYTNTVSLHINGRKMKITLMTSKFLILLSLRYTFNRVCGNCEHLQRCFQSQIYWGYYHNIFVLFSISYIADSSMISSLLKIGSIDEYFHFLTHFALTSMELLAYTLVKIIKIQEPHMQSKLPKKRTWIGDTKRQFWEHKSIEINSKQDWRSKIYSMDRISNSDTT